MWAKVLLPLALRDELLYSVPQSMEGESKVGKRVLVNMGKRTTYVGIITELFSDESSLPIVDFELKSLLFIVDKDPLVSQEEIEFWRFLAFYYLVPLGDILSLAIPSRALPRGTTRVVLDREALSSYQLANPQEEKHLEKLAQSGVKSISFTDFIALLGRSAAPLFDKLRLQDILQDEEATEVSSPPVGVESYSLSSQYASQEALNQLFLLLKRATAQKQILSQFIGALPIDEEEKPDLKASVPLAVFCKNEELQRNAFQRLKHKIPDLFRCSYKPQRVLASPSLKEHKKRDYAIPSYPLEKQKPNLYWATDDLDQYAFIASQVKATLAQGKRVLLLLPQSSSPEGDEAFVRPLLSLDSEPIAFLTGNTSQKERLELRKTLRETSEALLIVGSRIATFIPSEGLGLIIVAEEQDVYYKQQEPSPRFHARDSLIYRAQTLNIPFLMTAVTPSLETIYNTRLGKYHLICHKEQEPILPPKINLIDIRREREIHRLKRDKIIAQALQQKVTEVLSNKGKVLLLAARKGYAPFLSCSKCGESIRCHNCDVTLTYHRYREQLVCPYCGYTTLVPKQCPHCLQNGVPEEGTLKKRGFGSERIEDELQHSFPHAKIVRIDAEATEKKRAREHLKDILLSKEADIYVGTTLISRFTSLQNIKLIAVPQFDLLVSYPDFRNDEQLYSLFLRLSRRFPQAEWMLQLSDLKHPLVASIEQNVPHEVYDTLLAEREIFHFPPCQRLIRIILKGRDRQELEAASLIFSGALAQEKQAFLEVEKPFEPFVSRVNLLYIRHITLRLNTQVSSQYIRQRIWDIVSQLKKESLLCRKINLFFDVDPY